MDKHNEQFNFSLKQGILHIQSMMMTGDTISIGYEFDKWWCEVAPIGHTTYSEDNVFEALDDMAKWVAKSYKGAKQA